jgi:hypothetical protein
MEEIPAAEFKLDESKRAIGAAAVVAGRLG